VSGITRRTFLVRSAIGAGVLLGTGYLSRNLIQRYIAGVANTVEAPYNGPTDPSIWFEILADNRIRLHSPKVEMGQGIFTGLAQIAADELEVEVDAIQVVHATTASGNVDPLATGGSTTIMSLWQPLREMAATTREMIRLEGARQLGVDPASATASGGRISAGGRSLSYGEVVAASPGWELPETPALKPVAEYRFVGRDVPRVDLMEKVLGAPIFGMDVEMPDMLYGAVVRPTRIGARFAGADGSRAERMPGVVQVVITEDFAAVVAESYHEAQRARDAIEVRWEVGEEWDMDRIRSMMRVGEGDRQVIQKEGSPDRFLEEEGVIRAEYTSPMGAHAQLEPNGAVAHVTDEGAVVYISTQVAALTQREVADALGLDREQVDIRPTYLGGAFGRRLHTPNAIQAALLSRAVGRPVKCFLTRQEEFQHDTLRPPTHHVLRAALNGVGDLEAMEHQVSSGDVLYGTPLLPAIVPTLVGSDIGGWRGGMIQYGAIPNHQAVAWRVPLPFTTSWWRSLGLLANTFAIESFMDEVALEAGRDPVDFRLAHIQDDQRGFRLRSVIEVAAERAGWTTEVRDGVAMGFAASTDANTPVAQVAEVSIDSGQIRVHRVTCAIDPGLAVNPDQVRAQCEGAIIMGMSASLYEEMTIRDSSLWPVIYGPYQMALMRHAPREIEVEIVQNRETPGAVGEPPLGPIGAAVANAVARLTGHRLRDIPLQPALDRVLAG
jgi:isoquinoline 1-oxidoreductase beta subunit